jgi:PqqD family protein of HPr-rel-A system
MAGPRYIADVAGQLCSLELGDLAAIFHSRSGMTHIVAPPAPQILEALAEGEADAAEILLRMSRRFEIDGDDPLQIIEARLVELEAAGLVRSQ